MNLQKEDDDVKSDHQNAPLNTGGDTDTDDDSDEFGEFEEFQEVETQQQIESKETKIMDTSKNESFLKKQQQITHKKQLIITVQNTQQILKTNFAQMISSLNNQIIEDPIDILVKSQQQEQNIDYKKCKQVLNEQYTKYKKHLDMKCKMQIGLKEQEFIQKFSKQGVQQTQYQIDEKQSQKVKISMVHHFAAIHSKWCQSWSKQQLHKQLNISYTKPIDEQKLIKKELKKRYLHSLLKDQQKSSFIHVVNLKKEPKSSELKSKQPPYQQRRKSLQNEKNRISTKNKLQLERSIQNKLALAIKKS